MESGQRKENDMKTFYVKIRKRKALVSYLDETFIPSFPFSFLPCSDKNPVSIIAGVFLLLSSYVGIYGMRNQIVIRDEGML